MASKMELAAALAELEAGKFSYRMLDAIKDHTSTIEAELERVNALHGIAVRELRQQEYMIGRLEGELRKVNGRVHALVRANALTDIAVRETRRGAVALREQLPVARDRAVALLKQTMNFLSSIDYRAEFEKARAHPLTQKTLTWVANFDAQAEWNKFRTHPTTESARRELQQLLHKAEEYLPIARKQAAALVERVSAFIASMRKKAA